MRALGVAEVALLSGQRPVFDYPLPDQTNQVGTAVLVVSVAFIATVGAWLLLRFLWFAVRRFDEAGVMKQMRTQALLQIDALGDRLMELERNGQDINPRMAERHAAARALFDQAHTPEAMVTVREIAEEGLAVENA
jgi:hypothetical protein